MCGRKAGGARSFMEFTRDSGKFRDQWTVDPSVPQTTIGMRLTRRVFREA